MPKRPGKVSKKILHHELVPEHRLLSLEEAAEVLRRLGVKPWHLPQISVNDPVARLLKAKPGDIIEVRRRSPTAGEEVAYRIVVPQ
ncbi:MAG: DNA-directed RNA polymerase subunit H [Desulfurococcales archaeon]|nr:DNA-directed RNA polymerase subunit H [Desulfurococcales archaeon]